MAPVGKENVRSQLAAVETVFLDAGNTLIGLDLDWVVSELAAVGIDLSAEQLSRGEAAARPFVSKALRGTAGQSNLSSFELYLSHALVGLNVEPDGLRERVRAASRQLKAPGHDFRLWSRVLPGVPEALACLRDQGLQLVVVSNSDGSVEQALETAGLTVYLRLVVDSEIVGFEKPDPRLFLHALAAVRADARTTVHVGDMYYQDVIGARAAGIEAVLLDPGGAWQVDDCLVVDDLSTFARMLVCARKGRASGA
jgi:HAD superfamily hydrolase (TIGR01509 family)